MDPGLHLAVYRLDVPSYSELALFYDQFGESPVVMNLNLNDLSLLFVPASIDAVTPVRSTTWGAIKAMY